MRELATDTSHFNLVACHTRVWPSCCPIAKNLSILGQVWPLGCLKMLRDNFKTSHVNEKEHACWSGFANRLPRYFFCNRLYAKRRPQINSKKCVKDLICFLPNKALCPAFVLYLPPSKKPAILSFANSKASIDEVHRM